MLSRLGPGNRFPRDPGRGESAGSLLLPCPGSVPESLVAGTEIPKVADKTKQNRVKKPTIVLFLLLPLTRYQLLAAWMEPQLPS